MKVKLATWNGDTESVVYEDNVNWGINTLQFATTVDAILKHMMKHYDPRGPVSAVSIDITDEVLEKQVTAEYPLDRGLNKLW